MGARRSSSASSARTMPPWGADPPHGEFKNDPRLTRRRRSTRSSRGSTAARRRATTRTCRRRRSSPRAGRSASRTRSSRWPRTFKIPAERHHPVSVHPHPDEPDRRQVDSGDRDQAGRARAGAPRHRVHAAGRRSRSAGRRARADQHRRRDAEQAGRRVPSRASRGCCAATPTSSCRCTTRRTARRRRTARESASSSRRSRRRRCAAGGMALNPRFVIPAGDGNAEVRGRADAARRTRC